MKQPDIAVFGKLHNKIEQLVTLLGPTHFLSVLEIVADVGDLQAVKVEEVAHDDAITQFILTRVAETYEIEVNDLKSKRKHCEAKMIAAYLVRNYCDWSMERVAKAMDYSTPFMIWSYVDRMEKILAWDGVYTTLKNKYKAIRVKTDTFIEILNLDNQ